MSGIKEEEHSKSGGHHGPDDKVSSAQSLDSEQDFSSVDKVLNSKYRVLYGDERFNLGINFFIWLISSIAITVATGVYLWAKD